MIYVKNISLYLGTIKSILIIIINCFKSGTVYRCKPPTAAWRGNSTRASLMAHRRKTIFKHRDNTCISYTTYPCKTLVTMVFCNNVRCVIGQHRNAVHNSCIFCSQPLPQNRRKLYAFASIPYRIDVNEISELLGITWIDFYFPSAFSGGFWPCLVLPFASAAISPFPTTLCRLTSISSTTSTSWFLEQRAPILN